MNWKEVIDAIPGNLLLMIAYSFALAAAMTKSGLGSLLGRSFAIAFSSSPYVQLLGVCTLCVCVIVGLPPDTVARYCHQCHHCCHIQRRRRVHHVPNCGLVCARFQHVHLCRSLRRHGRQLG